jgi:hypothetical protein
VLRVLVTFLGSWREIHTVPLLGKIVQTSGLVIVLSEADASYRQIFTNGRPVDSGPPAALVVETNGFLGGQWLDRFGSPLTDQVKMTEKPWTIRRCVTLAAYASLPVIGLFISGS